MERKAVRRHERLSSASDSSSTSSESSSSSEDNSRRRTRKKGHQSKDNNEELQRLKRKVQELTKIRSEMPSKSEVWCIHCRENTHATSQCVKCDYCKKRGHLWEYCPIRVSHPSVRLAAPAAGAPVVLGGSTQSNYSTNNYQRPPPRKLICWTCAKEGHFARDCPETQKHQTTNPGVNIVVPQVATVTRAAAEQRRKT